MPKAFHLKVGVIIFTLFLLGACNAVQENERATNEAFALDQSVAETVEVFVEFQAATQTNIQLSASPTASHTATMTATATPSPTPEGPIAILLEDAECRSGPGKAYPVVEELEQGWVMSVLGLSADHEYYVLALQTTEENCWFSADLVNFLGETNELAIVTAPSTPTASLTPTPNVVWRGEWSIWVGPAPLTQYFMTVDHDGRNISASFDSGSGNIVTLNGSLDASYLIVRGIWNSSLGGSGTFVWEHKKNLNQFTGNIDGGPDDWCGARAGASLPSPCLGP